MRIKKLIVKNRFKYLWLKKIESVDLNLHCARCLIGTYNKSINNKISEISDLLLDDNVYYLCGVAYPFCYENNFHLAFREKLNSSIVVDINGISIEIDNAERLPISEDFIDTQNPKSNFKTYNTCRNWQFAFLTGKSL